MNKTIFIDKDGTLVEHIPYSADPKYIFFKPTVLRALREFKEHGFKVVVTTNQSGLAYGIFSEKQFLKARDKIRGILKSEKIVLDGFYYCPHKIDAKVDRFRKDCDCRKPKPGMIFKAAKDLGIDLKRSWMIGDLLSDVEAGKRAGCKTILIDCGNETEWVINKNRTPYLVAKNLMEAANFILFFERATFLKHV